MRLSRASTADGLCRALSVSLLLLVSAGCFDASATLGAYCDRDGDCAPEQSCDNHVCGLCGDGRVDPGELCIGSSRDYALDGDIAGMFSFDDDPEIPGRDLLMIANTFCPQSLGMGFEPCVLLNVLAAKGAREHEVATLPGNDFPSAWVRRFSVQDIDDDGTLDAVITFQGATEILVTYDPVSGMASPPVVLSASAEPEDVRVADLDGDGHKDLVAGLRVPGAAMEVFWGDGARMFSESSVYGGEDGARLADPVDMDGDGMPDVVVGSVLQGTLTVMRNLGGRMFEAGGPVSAGGTVAAAAVGDLDDDGFPDVVASLPGASQVVVFPNDGGSLSADAMYRLEVPAGPTDVQVADINQDGRPDVLVAGTDTDRVGLLLNRDGALVDRVDADVGPAPLFMLREDLDEDGAADLIVANASRTVSVLYADF